MHYSINFYAMNSRDFAQRLKHSRVELLGQIERRIQERLRRSRSDEPGTSALSVLLEAADNVCLGQIPADCGLEHFYALCWLAEVASERVTICPFQGFRHYCYLEEIGIWPWLLRVRPPFAVPTCISPRPEVGFVTYAEIQRLIPKFELLLPSDSREVVNAREEFRDILESLVRDEVDLLAVLI